MYFGMMEIHEELNDGADHMTTATSLQPSTNLVAVRPGRLAVAAIVATAINLAVFAAGSIAELDWHLGSGQSVSAGLVALMTLMPFLVVGAATFLIVHKRPGFRHWAAWGGLAFGILGAPMAFVADARTSTAIALASMHLTAGIGWFLGLMPEATRPRR